MDRRWRAAIWAAALASTGCATASFHNVRQREGDESKKEADVLAQAGKFDEAAKRYGAAVGAYEASLLDQKGENNVAKVEMDLGTVFIGRANCLAQDRLDPDKLERSASDLEMAKRYFELVCHSAYKNEKAVSGACFTAASLAEEIGARKAAAANLHKPPPP